MVVKPVQRQEARMKAQAPDLKRNVAGYLAATEFSLAVDTQATTLFEELWTIITREGKGLDRIVQNGRSPGPATARHGTQSARNRGARKAGSKAHVSSLVLKGIAADQPCHTVRGNEEATARLRVSRGYAWALHEVNRGNGQHTKYAMFWYVLQLVRFAPPLI